VAEPSLSLKSEAKPRASTPRQNHPDQSASLAAERMLRAQQEQSGGQ
jgi:hypothetical protein